MLEETGLTVEPGHLIGRVQRPGLDGAVIDIRDYAATVIGGTLRPGDDAADARWVGVGDLDSLEVTEGLTEALTTWGVLGQERQLSSYFSAYNRQTLFAPSGGRWQILLAQKRHLRRNGYLLQPGGVAHGHDGLRCLAGRLVDHLVEVRSYA